MTLIRETARQVLERLNRGEGPLLSHAAALEAELALDLGPIDPRDGPPHA